MTRRTCNAALLRLGYLALLAVVLGCSGCAWFKTPDSPETPDVNLREDPSVARLRPKREGGKHLYGGLSAEANAIERNLGY